MSDPAKSRTEIKVSILAVAIAFISLGFSIWQGCETRQHDRLSLLETKLHNRLSVKPSLQIASNTAPGPEYGLILYNNGVGPALVNGWKIKFNHKLMGEYIEGKGEAYKWENIENGWLKIRKKLGIKPELIACGSHGVIRAGQRYPIFWVTQADWNNKEKFSEQDQQKFIKALDQIKVEIDYESIYGKDDDTFKCIYEIKKAK